MVTSVQRPPSPIPLPIHPSHSPLTFSRYSALRGEVPFSFFEPRARLLSSLFSEASHTHTNTCIADGLELTPLLQNNLSLGFMPLEKEEKEGKKKKKEEKTSMKRKVTQCLHVVYTFFYQVEKIIMLVTFLVVFFSPSFLFLYFC